MPACKRLRVLLAATVVAALAGAAHAQRPPDVAWRAPVLQVEGSEQPVRLDALSVDVEVAGGAAQTRVRMVFFNPNSRVLEGKLQFPLAAGQAVAGFALDIDGTMREAVPVTKARAEQVFEDITRRRVDPGLLQATLGNNYELRVYPLMPGKTRTVELVVVEPAQARLALPLAYAGAGGRVGSLDVRVRFPAATVAPQILGASPLPLSFVRDAGGGFVARASARDAALPRDPLVVASAALPIDGVAVATADAFGVRAFTIELGVPTRTAPRALPKSVQIVWDASGSGAARRIDRELALLDAYFARARDSVVDLVRVADTAAPGERFEVRGGDWSALRRALEATRYDGASNLGAVRHDGTSAEAIWFSDGLATYGEPWKLAFPVPVYAVNSAASSHPAALQALADASGGQRIDLVASSNAAAAEQLLRRGTQVTSVSATGARDLVVQPGSAASGRAVVAGVLDGDDAEVEIRLRDASGAVSVRRVDVKAGERPARLAALQWARLTIDALEADPRANKQRVAELGKRFRLATRETSLLVLETVDDYVRFEIEPPAELRAAFDKLAQASARRRGESDAARLERVVRRFEARVAWWNRDFPKDAPPEPLAIAKAAAEGRPGGAGAGALDVMRQLRPTPATGGASSRDAAQEMQADAAMRERARSEPASGEPPRRATANDDRSVAARHETASPALARSAAALPLGDAAARTAKASTTPMAPLPAPAPSLFAAQSESESTPRRKDAGRDRKAADGAAPSSSISIGVSPAATSSAAMRRLRAARADEQVAVYFDERRAHATSVAFYLDAAEHFLGRTGDREARAQGLRALSNLAEVDLQNRQVLRLLGYRLQQAGEAGLAVPIFERVLELAPHEPQSHRDLGLALAEVGQTQRAVDRLYEVATGAWDARFADVELIAIAEMNAVIAKARRDGKAVDTSAIDKRLQRHLPVDVRVVLAWDADNTDVDLHVIDPNGEEVFYGRALSYQGGAITRDATGGYGPEEFALRVAKPGTYRVEAQFFGHRQQVIASGTGLMMWLSSGFGTAEQRDRRATVQMRSEKSERVVVGEFEVRR